MSHLEAQPVYGCMFVTTDGRREQRPYFFRDGKQTPLTEPGELLAEAVGGGFFITRASAEKTPALNNSNS